MSIPGFALIYSGPWDYLLPRSRYEPERALRLSRLDSCLLIMKYTIGLIFSSFVVFFPRRLIRSLGASFVSPWGSLTSVLSAGLHLSFSYTGYSPHLMIQAIYPCVAAIYLAMPSLTAETFHSVSKLVIPFGQSRIGTPVLQLSFCCLSVPYNANSDGSSSEPPSRLQRFICLNSFRSYFRRQIMKELKKSHFVSSY